MHCTKILFIVIIACQLACSTDKSDDIEDSSDNIEDPSKFLYKDSFCGIRDLFWLNNETIIFTDHCGNLKKISIISNAEQKITQFLDHNHLHQKSFFTNQIPNSFFYLALTPNGEGTYVKPIKLFRLDLLTEKIQLVADSLHNPHHGGYFLGNKHIAVQSFGNDTILVINLENLITQKIVHNGLFKTFSPDDKEALIYLFQSNTNKIYDFDCQCLRPNPIQGFGNPIWRNEGLFGVIIHDRGVQYDDLIFNNFTSGEVLGEMPGVVNWGAEPQWTVAPQGTLTVSFIFSPSYAFNSKASLVAFDLVKKVKQTLVTVKPIQGFSENYIEKIAISPDQKKIAYVYNIAELRVVDI